MSSKEAVPFTDWYPAEPLTTTSCQEVERIGEREAQGLVRGAIEDVSRKLA